ncbi:MAG: hypothetical protein KTR31_22785, partial [Myxococcales bacterium]|nr:hypothetical protein [Myxococcales bacterium]
MHRRDECCGLVSILVAASAWLVVGCAGGPELELRDTAELAARFGTIQEPMSGGACWVSPPGVPRFGAGNSWPNGEIIVRNQTQLVDAIRTVNDRGGAIYIQNNITVTEQLPTIKRNNVRISSRAEFVLYDAVAGGDRASEMFRVEGNNFVMRDVSIQGVGHRNPNNPGAWSGKRSAVAVVGNNAEIHRVYIRFFTHAAVRFEG